MWQMNRINGSAYDKTFSPNLRGLETPTLGLPLTPLLSHKGLGHRADGPLNRTGHIAYHAIHDEEPP